MAARRKERNDKHDDIWASLLKLANNDDQVVRAAALRATDVDGRVCVKTIKKHILKITNPALLATIEAADEFKRVVQCEDKFIDLPHLHRIYELAEKDLKVPGQVFNAAAKYMADGAGVDFAIHTAIVQHHERPSLH